MGPEVDAFEQEFVQFLGTKHAFAVSNATAALHLSLLALGIGAGDEVIQPAMNFVAAANMTVAVGATPVFGDIISLSEPTLDPNVIEQHLTSRTKAVIVMHYGGYLCRMAEIAEICNQHGLALIEDACHAIGAKYVDPKNRSPHGKMAGNLGDVGTFSFFGNKNLVTGEGGMVVTNRDDLADRIKLLRSHGMSTLTWDRHQGHASSYEVLLNGCNYRLDELHAALGRVQLAKLTSNNERRTKATEIYRERLKALTDWTIPFADYEGDSVSHLMVVVAPNEKVRTDTVRKLKGDGVQTSMHYPCVSDFKAFDRWRTDSINNSRRFALCALTLPLYPDLSSQQIDSICSLLGIKLNQLGPKISELTEKDI
jgi:dTDP-4-amino-4,6-dideoxygalactose transaminase